MGELNSAHPVHQATGLTRKVVSIALRAQQAVNAQLLINPHASVGKAPSVQGQKQRAQHALKHFTR